MNISQFAALTGMSAHTLRYYEKIGLLHSVVRNGSGHRDYSAKEAEWIGFITRLKETGMPLKQILTYAELRAQGDATASRRQQLLEQHATQLAERIRQEQEHLLALKQKIHYYQDHFSG